MLRKAVCAVAVLALSVVAARAEEINGSIQKIADGKIKVGIGFDKETKTFKEEKTFTLAKDVKVLTAKFNKEDKKVEVGDKLEGGLDNERLKNITGRGVRARLIVTDGQVTEIHVLPQRKKKGA